MPPPGPSKSREGAAKAEATKNDTVEEVIDPGQAEAEWFKEGAWRPAWGNVEFVGRELGISLDA